MINIENFKQEYFLDYDNQTVELPLPASFFSITVLETTFRKAFDGTTDLKETNFADAKIKIFSRKSKEDGWQREYINPKEDYYITDINSKVNIDVVSNSKQISQSLFYLKLELDSPAIDTKIYMLIRGNYYGN